MPFPALDGAPADVLRLFLREAPYLFFGSAFAAIGLVAGSFVAIRQRRDTLLTFFALFAILCGLRLWIQSDIVVLALGKSFLLEQLRTDIEFLIPVPMFLFFVAAGYVGRAGRIAGYVLTAEAVVHAVLTGLSQNTEMYRRIGEVVLVIALLVLAVELMQTSGPELRIFRLGLLAFAVLAFFDVLVRGLSRPWIGVRPNGLVVFLFALGYVAAQRALQKDRRTTAIQRELEVATKMQLSILPPEFVPSRHFRVAARYIPMTSVAGDFYDFIGVTEWHAGFLVADVSGHGVPAALIASMVKLAAASQRKHAAQPSKFLSGMNAVLCGNTQQQLVTAAYLHLDPGARRLRYSGAGHPPMLLVRNGKAISIEENGLVLAAFDFASYSDLEYPLQDGDRFVLYTDGLLEAADAAGNFFGQARLCAKAEQTSGLAPSDAADTLLSAVRNWSVSQMDDLTLIVCDCSL